MGEVLGLGCQGERSSLIVIWNALLLHARFSGIARTRGLATIAIFGNIVTAWSWFGTNMLGVGLHSYGFMDKAFNSLMGFILSQLAIIALAYVPATVKMLIKLGANFSPFAVQETGASSATLFRFVRLTAEPFQFRSQQSQRRSRLVCRMCMQRGRRGPQAALCA